MPLKPRPSTPTSTTRVDKRTTAKAAAKVATAKAKPKAPTSAAVATRPQPLPESPNHGRKRLDGRRGNVITSDAIDYDDAEMEFMKAVQAWKKRTGKLFPAISELLAIARELGYRKVATASSD
jgi:hypothetical protein